MFDLFLFPSVGGDTEMNALVFNMTDEQEANEERGRVNHTVGHYCIVEDDNYPMHQLLKSCGHIAAEVLDDSDVRGEGTHAYEFRYLRDWIKADA